MPRRTLRLTDAAHQTQQGPDSKPGDEASTQAAFVRALSDEVDRHHPRDRRIVTAREQLGEEIGRLSELVARKSPLPPPPVDAPLEVLVVDDEAECRHAAQLAVEHLGFACRAAASGEEALAEIARRRPDVVVTDWRMPGVSGLELCKELKRAHEGIYVILATGDPETATKLEHHEDGPDDFLEKPLDLDELERRMNVAARFLRAIRRLGAAIEAPRG